MLQFFRNFFSTKFGALLGIAFVILLGVLFLAGDVGTRFLGAGGLSGDTVATVGKRKITTRELEMRTREGLENYRQQDPRASMQSFVAQGALDKMLEGLIDVAAVGGFGDKYGIVASDRLIGSEIARIPAFRGTDGNFSQQAYLATIQRFGLTDAQARQQFSDSLIGRQIQGPTTFGARVPMELANRYAALLTETRQGGIAMIPSLSFAPKGDPAPGELEKFYAAHRNNYIRPERRVIRYAVFDDAAIKNVPAPTDAEIAAQYNKDQAKYAASETRKLSQLVVPTEAAGQAIMNEIAKGATLESAALGKKLMVAAIPAISRDAYSAQNSAGAADAVFSAPQGKLVGPVKGGLGWYLVRVDAITKSPGKTLDQARAEIVTALTAAKKRVAVADFSSRIEDEFDNGGTLADVAKELSLEIKLTPELTADGKVYGHSDQSGPPELAKVIATAFAMEREGQPQLAEVEPGKTFVVFEANSIQASAPAPFAQIRNDVLEDWKLAKGEEAAKAAAQKLQAAASKGQDLSALIAGLGVPIPPVDNVDMNRQQLTKMGQQVPPPLALLFSMAKGTVKVLAAPRNRGWYVVSLRQIVPGTVDPKGPLPGQVQAELSQLASREYADQLRRAIRDDVGVSKNKSAIDALAKSLLGN